MRSPPWGIINATLLQGGDAEICTLRTLGSWSVADPSIIDRVCIGYLVGVCTQGRIDWMTKPDFEKGFREYAAAITAPHPGERVQRSRTWCSNSRESGPGG